MPGALNPLASVAAFVRLGTALDRRGRDITYSSGRGEAVHHYTWRGDIGRHLPIALQLPAAIEHLARIADTIGVWLTYPEGSSWGAHLDIWRQQVGIISFRNWSSSAFLVHVAKVLDTIGERFVCSGCVWREMVGRTPTEKEPLALLIHIAKILDAIQDKFTYDRRMGRFWKDKFWTAKVDHSQILKEFPALLEEIAVFLDDTANILPCDSRQEWRREPLGRISSTHDPRVILEHIAEVLRSLKKMIIISGPPFH